MATRDVREKWRSEGAGERYAAERWDSKRRRERDPRRVDALLARHLGARPRAEVARLLDAPCGAGRLLGALARHGSVVGLDVSPSMLAAARAAHPDAELLLGDVERLPFPDASFDAVVCCRLLHHLPDPAARARVLAELVRVSRGLVIASFWDAGSLPAWRTRVLPRRLAPRRHALSRTALAAELARCGAEVVGFAHSLRFVSRQAFVVARRRG